MCAALAASLVISTLAGASLRNGPRLGTRPYRRQRQRCQERPRLAFSAVTQKSLDFFDTAEIHTPGYWEARSSRDVARRVLDHPFWLGPGGESAAVDRAIEAIKAAVQVTPLATQRLRCTPRSLPNGSANPAWLTAHRWRLPASKAHAVVHAQKTGTEDLLAERLINRDSWWGSLASRLEGFTFNGPSIASGEALLATYECCLQKEGQVLERPTSGTVPRAPRWARRPAESELRNPGPPRLERIGALASSSCPWILSVPWAAVVDADGQPVGIVQIGSDRGELYRSAKRIEASVDLLIANSCFGNRVLWCEVMNSSTRMKWRDVNQELMHALRKFYFDTYLPLAAKRFVQWLESPVGWRFRDTL